MVIRRRLRTLLMSWCVFIVIAFLLAIGAEHQTSLGDAPKQDATTTPTPVGIVPGFVQESNQGNVQLLTFDEVANRTGIRAWHNAGWTGAGVNVGVIDRGFGELLDFESDFGAEVAFMPGMDKSVYDADEVAHGTHVLETVHTIAPGASLFACRYDTYDQFAICIDWMLAANVDIINHSAGVPALPLDGRNIWAQQVDRAADDGVLWVNAAGNFAQGYISDFFTDANINGMHEFRGFTGINETLAVESTGGCQEPGNNEAGVCAKNAADGCTQSAASRVTENAAGEVGKSAAGGCTQNAADSETPERQVPSRPKRQSRSGGGIWPTGEKQPWIYENCYALYKQVKATGPCTGQ